MEFIQSTVSFNDKEVKIWHLLIAFLIMGVFAALCAWGLSMGLGYISAFGLSKTYTFILSSLLRAIIFAITHSVNSSVASHTWGDNAGTFDLLFA